MSDLQATTSTTAVIIPFPRAVPPAVAPADPAERLRTALLALDAALKAQLQAVAGWRGALGELQGSVQNLKTSLHGYNDRLAALGGQVDTANAESRRLEAWADGVLQTQK